MQQQEIFPSSPSFLTEQRADYLKKIAPGIGTAEPPSTTITPVLTQEIKDYEYRNYIIDLTVAHTGYPSGLIQLGIVADSMTIIQADSAFSYTLNRISNDPTNAAVGMKENEFEIREIYITNIAAVGQAIIRVIWNPRLIRIR